MALSHVKRGNEVWQAGGGVVAVAVLHDSILLRKCGTEPEATSPETDTPSGSAPQRLDPERGSRANRVIDRPAQALPTNDGLAFIPSPRVWGGWGNFVYRIRLNGYFRSPCASLAYLTYFANHEPFDSDI